MPIQVVCIEYILVLLNTSLAALVAEAWELITMPVVHWH